MSTYLKNKFARFVTLTVAVGALSFVGESPAASADDGTTSGGAVPPGYSLSQTGDMHDFDYFVGAWITEAASTFRSKERTNRPLVKSAALRLRRESDPLRESRMNRRQRPTKARGQEPDESPTLSPYFRSLRITADCVRLVRRAIS